VAAIIGVGLVAAVANALYFGAPRITQVAAESAGQGVEKVDVSGEAAMVTVKPDWPSTGGTNLPPLIGLLRNRGVKRALIMNRTGGMIGTLEVATGRLSLVKPADAKQ